VGDVALPRAALAVVALLAVASAGPARAADSAEASPVKVRASASKSEVTVGEAFSLEIEATGPEGTSYSFPAELSGDAFELRTQEGPATGAAAAAAPQPGSHRYVAAVYALGEAQVPPIQVRYRLPDGTTGEASSEPVALKVVSLLPKDPQQQKLADIRGPASVGIGRAFWVALAGVLALVAALAVWAVRRRRKAMAPAPVVAPVQPPDVEAAAALEALAARGLHGRGEYRLFYIELATIVKRYLERRLDAPVLEMTTAETVAFLRDHPHGGDTIAVVRDLADAADQVKFARGDGLAAEAERHLAAARALVPALEARLRPASTEPVAGRAA
jgi:hypothetical protein